MTQHTITYQYNRDNPSRWRALCTCGWFMYGTRDECDKRAPSHDLEWISETRVPEWKLRLQEIKGR